MSEEQTLLLRKDFAPVSSAEWEQCLRDAMKGGEISRLYWKTDEEITVKPFYRAEDLKELSQFEGAGGARTGNEWRIRQAIAVADPQQANAAARDAIAGGAEAICFEAVPESGGLRGVAVQSAEDMRALIAGLPRATPQQTQPRSRHAGPGAPCVPLSFRARQAARTS